MNKNSLFREITNDSFDNRSVVTKSGPRKSWSALIFSRHPDTKCLICKGVIVGTSAPPTEEQIYAHLEKDGLDLINIQEMGPDCSYPIFVHMVWNGSMGN